ncbi:C40 family peptidase [Streptomyces sp. GS7]|uniref:C40 family peptidase n=1 Tax=Streptomyces sp. GS7 TaxID=2692234 RepID=UPI0013184A54|nr:C40 family peptidase [Streptomyces sp. GS7]QHC25880.1 NlpC/P60 family protein [Streptomyces sp. GS7]
MTRVRTAAPPAVTDTALTDTVVTALDGPDGAEAGTTAATRHRTGAAPAAQPPTVRPPLSADPQRCLDGATVLERTGSHQATAVTGHAHRLGSVRRLHRRAGTNPEHREEPEATTAHLPKTGAAGDRLPETGAIAGNHLPQAGTARGHLPETGTTKGHLSGAGTALVGQRSATVQTLGTAEDPRGHPGPEQRRRATTPDPRAARAVAFAYAALGKPYAWGATGPSAYDCSGLVQAAWKSGGVTLPRTTYTQINAGPRVDRPQLAPGDLVFFHSGISHVGIYVGDGKMIHAPHPGAPVRIAPIDRLPFAGATRPA